MVVVEKEPADSGENRFSLLHDAVGTKDLPKSFVGIVTEADQLDLQRLGRTQQLNRNFNFVSILGFSAVLMSTWEGMLTASVQGLIDGGTAGLIWMYIVAFIGFVFVNASMAEMASMAPTSGGQYHWVSEFAPPSCQRFLSYITGWVCVLAWQTGGASVAFLAGTQIQGLIILNDINYGYERWHGTLLVIAVAAVSVLINTVFAKFLPHVESGVLVLHLCGFVAILVPLWVLAPRNDASTVFLEFTNGGNWPSMGLSCLVGLLSPVFSLLGSDSVTHMAEEVKDASLVLPRAMMLALWINGSLALVMLITFCFCLGDVETILQTQTGYPFIQVFYNISQSHAGATVMTVIIITLTAAGYLTNVASASRQMFAFARDKGLPFSGFLSHIKPGWNIPLNAIMVTFTITTLLSLINIGSTVAFNAIASLGVASLTTSYMISFCCLVHRRLRGKPLPEARWSLGRFGLVINVLAILFLVVVVFFSFFPLGTPVVATDMNWSIVMYGGAVMFAVAYFLAVGRRTYAGPVVIIKVE